MLGKELEESATAMQKSVRHKSVWRLAGDAGIGGECTALYIKAMAGIRDESRRWDITHQDHLLYLFTLLAGDYVLSLFVCKGFLALLNHKEFETLRSLSIVMSSLFFICTQVILMHLSTSQ